MAELTLIKSVKNAQLFEDKNGNKLIRIDKIRFGYPNFGTPREEEAEDGTKSKAWSGVGMLPKATHLEAMKLCKEVIEELMAANKAKVPKDKWFISDGDEKEAETDHGHWLIAVREAKTRPKARNNRGEVMDDIADIDKVFYGGMWGHMLIRPWFFGGTAKGKTKTFPKRVSCGINAIVFYKDDKPFGMGKVDDTDAWSNLPDDGEDPMGSATGGGSNEVEDDPDAL